MAAKKQAKKEVKWWITPKDNYEVNSLAARNTPKGFSNDADDRLMLDRAAYTPRKPPLPRNIRNKITVKNSPLDKGYQSLAENREYGRLGTANQRVVDRASTMAPYQPGQGPTRKSPRGPGFKNTQWRDPYGLVADRKKKSK